MYAFLIQNHARVILLSIPGFWRGDLCRRVKNISDYFFISNRAIWLRCEFRSVSLKLEL